MIILYFQSAQRQPCDIIAKKCTGNSLLIISFLIHVVATLCQYAAIGILDNGMELYISNPRSGYLVERCRHENAKAE